MVNFLYSKPLLSSVLGILKMDTADCPFFFKMQSPLVAQGQTERLLASERHQLPGMIQIPSLLQEAVNSCEKCINCSWSLSYSVCCWANTSRQCWQITLKAFLEKRMKLFGLGWLYSSLVSFIDEEPSTRLHCWVNSVLETISLILFTSRLLWRWTMICFF